jgi:membrane protein implicated in regulation of membrane protease activity
MRAAAGRYTVENDGELVGAREVQTWIIWVIIAAVLGTVEIVTTTLAFGLVALAAIVAAGAGAAGGSAAIQFGAFVLASAVGLGVARPLALRHVRQPPLLRTGTAALVGRPATVLEEVTGYSGRVRIGGEVWSARAYDETLVIPAGKTVDVMLIEGVTALVYPRE